MLRSSEMFSALERSLRGLGLDMAVVVVPEKGALTGLSIEQIERRAEGKFFIVRLNRKGGDTISSPDRSLIVQGGDGVVIVSRSGQVARAMFEAPAEKVRAGRATF
jgi:Trk K+ transport system NAD-binding subunit